MDVEKGYAGGGGSGSSDDAAPSWGALLSLALSRRDTRSLTYFCLALTALMVVEMGYGLAVDSIGLISDAMHMAFHTAAMGITVFGVLLSKRQASFAFSYGWERYEVLAAFSNALMLVFVCLFVSAGAVHRLIEPRAFAEAGIPYKLEFGAAGLALNILGVLALGPGLGSMDHLQRYALGGEGGHRSPGLGIRSAALHAYADAVSSLAVLLSVLASRAGWVDTPTADTLQSLATAAFTMYIAVPLFTATGMVLLGTRPPSLAAPLDRARREALTLEGVLEVVEQHAWTQVPGLVVGSVRVRARADAGEAGLTARLHALYSRAGLTDLTVEVEKEGSEWAGAPPPVSASGGGCSHDHGGGSHGHAHGSSSAAHGHAHGGHDDDHGHGHGGGAAHHGHSHG